ncbi:MAG: 7-carboxy-7-deazaguanine synthase QueE [Candidatus Dasytiphilus stammeri]
MFGQNPVRKKAPDSENIWIEEIFQTIQGEGPYSGYPATFIRLSGCNLKCYWCDTQFESFKWNLNPIGIIKQIKKLVEYPTPELVVITGGEPFRQNIAPLIDLLIENNFKVQIETNGTIHRPIKVDKNLTIVCSPKTPQLHPRTIEIITHYKYVIAYGEIDDFDGLPIFCTQVKGKKIKLFRPPIGKPVYIMPRDDYDQNRNKKNINTCIEIAMKYGRTLNLQLHKELELP